MNIRISILLIPFFLTCCSGLAERLERVGKSPDFQEVNTYEEEILDNYNQRGITEPIKNLEPKEARPQTANSLWKPGARQFFKDQRARSVGDILKVAVTIQDQAKLDNKTSSSRKDKESLGAPNVFGLEKYYDKILPDTADPASLIGISSNDSNDGQGKIDRKETIRTTVAATVVKILPNNNLVIHGTQEIRVNFEVREISIDGVVQPEDISSDNSVTLDQVAEARVIYGGRGVISDHQQPRYGKQLIDAISPF